MSGGWDTPMSNFTESGRYARAELKEGFVGFDGDGDTYLSYRGPLLTPLSVRESSIKGFFPVSWCVRFVLWDCRIQKGSCHTFHTQRASLRVCTSVCRDIGSVCVCLSHETSGIGTSHMSHRKGFPLRVRLCLLRLPRCRHPLDKTIVHEIAG